MLIEQEMLEADPKLDLCQNMVNPQITISRTNSNEVLNIIIFWNEPKQQRLLFSKQPTTMTYYREISLMIRQDWFTLAKLRELLIATPSITLKKVYGLLVDQWATIIYPQLEDMRLKIEQQQYPTV